MMGDCHGNNWSLPKGCKVGALIIRKLGIRLPFSNDYSYCKEPYVFEGLNGVNMLISDTKGRHYTVTPNYNDGNWILFEDIFIISYSFFAWAYGFEIYFIQEVDEIMELGNPYNIGKLIWGGDYHLILEVENEEFVLLLDEIDPTALFVKVNEGMLMPLVFEHQVLLFDKGSELFE